MGANQGVNISNSNMINLGSRKEDIHLILLTSKHGLEALHVRIAVHETMNKTPILRPSEIQPHHFQYTPYLYGELLFLSTYTYEKGAWFRLPPILVIIICLIACL